MGCVWRILRGMKLFMKHVHDSTSAVCFDISASYVAATIAVVTPTGVRKVWEKRIEHTFDGGTDYSRYEHAMCTALLEVGMSVVSEGLSVARQNPSFSVRDMRLCVAFASPWSLGGVYTGMVKHEKPFEVTTSLLDGVRSELYERFTHEDEYARWYALMGASEVLEVCPEGTWCDGYRVSDPEGCTVKEVQQRVYFTVVSQQVARQVREVLGRVFPNHVPLCMQSTWALCKKVVVPGTDYAVVVELDGHLTTIVLVRDGAPAGVCIKPFGTSHAVRALAPQAASVQEAISVAEHAVGGGVLGDMSGFQEVLTSWHGAFVEAVTELCDGATPPGQVYLAANNPWFSVYADTIELPWKQPGIRHSRALHVVNREDVQVPGTSLAGTPLNTRSDLLLAAMCISTVAPKGSVV